LKILDVSDDLIQLPGPFLRGTILGPSDQLSMGDALCDQICIPLRVRSILRFILAYFQISGFFKMYFYSISVDFIQIAIWMRYFVFFEHD